MKKRLCIFLCIMSLLCMVCSVCIAFAAPISEELSVEEQGRNEFWKTVHTWENERSRLFKQFEPDQLAELTELEDKLEIDVFNKTYLRPESNDLLRSDVIAIAQNEVSQAFMKAQEQFTPFEVSLFCWKGETTVYWYVSFVEGGYCLLTRDGLITSQASRGMLTPDEQFQQFGVSLSLELAIEQYGMERYYFWPLEVQAQLADYGLPTTNDLSADAAIELAIQAIHKQSNGKGMAADTMIGCSFRTGGTWEIFFFQPLNELYAQCYIDSITGEVISLYFASNANG